MPAVLMSQAMPYTYSLTFNAIAGGATAAAQLILDNDSLFDFYSWVAATDQDPVVKNTDVGAILPDNFSALIQNQSSGRYFSPEPLRRSMFAGTSVAYALREARAIRFDRKTQLNFQVTNLLPGTAITVQIGLKGYKIFDSLNA